VGRAHSRAVRSSVLPDGSDDRRRHGSHSLAARRPSEQQSNAGHRASGRSAAATKCASGEMGRAFLPTMRTRLRPRGGPGTSQPPYAGWGASLCGVLESVEVSQPVGDPVPTGDNLAHHFLSNQLPPLTNSDFSVPVARGMRIVARYRADRRLRARHLPAASAYTFSVMARFVRAVDSRSSADLETEIVEPRRPHPVRRRCEYGGGPEADLPVRPLNDQPEEFVPPGKTLEELVTKTIRVRGTDHASR